VYNIYYVVDNSKTHKASYVINFYKDGKIVEADQLSGEKVEQILTQAIVNVEYTADENKYEGYTIDTENSDRVDATVSTE
jgi:hypothetical protein